MIGAAILFSGHPYMWAHYREPIITVYYYYSQEVFYMIYGTRSQLKCHKPRKARLAYIKWFKVHCIIRCIMVTYQCYALNLILYIVYVLYEPY